MKHITSQNKLHYIDALRGYAIIGVLLAHTIQFSFFNLPNGLRKIIEAGAFGVQLFFVTSAFTLFFSFHKRSKKELFSSLNFFIRRFFRIAPMFYIGVAYYLFQDGFGPRFWLGDETKVTLANVFSNLLFFNGLNPYWINSIVPGSWSIAAEVIFYAILPFLFLRIKNLNQAFNFLILSLLLNGLFHFILNNIHLIGSDRLWSDYLVFYFPNQLPIFALGIVMYFIVRGKDGWNTISNKSILVFGGLLLLQFSTGIPVVFSEQLIWGIGFLMLGVLLNSFKLELIVNPIVCFIGKISFSMYLVHFAVLHWLKVYNIFNYFENNFFGYVLSVLTVLYLVIPLSWIFYKGIEVPFQHLGQRIIKRLD